MTTTMLLLLLFGVLLVVLIRIADLRDSSAEIRILLGRLQEQAEPEYDPPTLDAVRAACKYAATHPDSPLRPLFTGDGGVVLEGMEDGRFRSVEFDEKGEVFTYGREVYYDTDNRTSHPQRCEHSSQD